MFHVPIQYRVRSGHLASDDTYGNNGAFQVTHPRDAKRYSKPPRMLCIASDGMLFEHVSISLNRPRCPKWEEMCYIKNLFWDKEDAVIQIHPPADQYVDCHPFTLHLWRKAGTNDFYEAPPSYMVGPK